MSLLFHRQASASTQSYIDLAQSHFAQDLEESDRQALQNAGAKLRNYTSGGAIIGGALGLALAVRSRQNLHRAVVALRAQVPPVKEMIMRDGKHVDVPLDAMKNLPEPGPFSTFFSTFFISTLGLLLGGNIGLLAGSYSAKSTVQSGADVGRLQEAYRRFQIDLLKRELAELESGSQAKQNFWS